MSREQAPPIAPGAPVQARARRPSARLPSVLRPEAPPTAVTTRAGRALERRPAEPALLPQVKLSEFMTYETNFEAAGQSELAEKLTGGPLDKETKKIHADKWLQAVDRLGVASIGR